VLREPKRSKLDATDSDIWVNKEVFFCLFILKNLGYKLDGHSSLLVCPLTSKGFRWLTGRIIEERTQKNYHVIPTGTSLYDCDVNYKF
jgi:hypothetical protein